MTSKEQAEELLLKLAQATLEKNVSNFAVVIRVEAIESIIPLTELLEVAKAAAYINDNSVSEDSAFRTTKRLMDALSTLRATGKVEL